MDYYSPLKKILFKADPESVHHLTMKMLALCPTLTSPFAGPIDNLNVKLIHTQFRSPFGLAAGLDKNAECLEAWGHLPLGGVEVGTVTLKAQAGNPRPRIFRQIESQNIINRMGFPSQGVDVVKKHLRKTPYTLGLNIGKNKETTPAQAIEEYTKLAQALDGKCDYLVVNLSSPNTPGLRDLQNEKFLGELKNNLNNCQTPIYIKLSPDLDDADARSLIKTICELRFQGIIATNTTIEHDFETGGLSGRSLSLKAQKVRDLILNELSGTNLDFMGVGGFSDFKDVLHYWEHGGKFLQVYTAFIFQGPGLFKQWCNLTHELLKFGNKNTLEEAFQDRKIFKAFAEKLK